MRSKSTTAILITCKYNVKVNIPHCTWTYIVNDTFDSLIIVVYHIYYCKDYCVSLTGQEYMGYSRI